MVVEVEDDGRGIDADRIRRAAVERGLANPDTVAGMNDGAVIDLIFMAGFSTATDVTDLSGRGVGMDAARASIERLGGRVQLETRKGAGSTVRFVLPFSVMMTRVMTVEAGGQWFGIPLDAVIETIRVPRREDPIRRSGPCVRAPQSDRSPDRTGRDPWMGEGGIELRRDRGRGVERRCVGGVSKLTGSARVWTLC